MRFPVVRVPYPAVRLDEAMGTKRKFWYLDDQLGPSLFKAVRRGPGEDWAEKVAQECAALLGVPHARYELAVCDVPGGEPLIGVVSPTFVRPQFRDGAFVGGRDRMVHGNELLAAAEPAYAETAGGTRGTRSPHYTVALVLRTVAGSGAAPPDAPAGAALPPDVAAAADVLVGYLMADAWVGNTDRHEENWAVVDVTPDVPNEPPRRVLAPYYDSASCLGRNEPDAARLRRLRSRDANDTVEAYADRARSAFAGPGGAPVTPLGAFRDAAAVRPAAALAWLARLDGLSAEALPALFARFPEERLSGPARDFARRVLDYNRGRLLGLRPTIEDLLARPPEGGR